MNHPELLLIPVMMLSDYFLTVWGAILSEKKYRLHFKIEHYELNPIWQKNIAKKQWFNTRHLAIVAIVTVYCLVLSSFWSGKDMFAEGLFGFMVILNASVIGTHLTNILTFRYVNLHPESMAGEISMSHLMIIKASQFRAVSLLWILALIAVFSPSPFIIGGLCSQIGFLLIKIIWIAKAKAVKKKQILQQTL